MSTAEQKLALQKLLDLNSAGRKAILDVESEGELVQVTAKLKDQDIYLYGPMGLDRDPHYDMVLIPKRDKHSGRRELKRLRFSREHKTAFPILKSVLNDFRVRRKMQKSTLDQIKQAEAKRQLV